MHLSMCLPRVRREIRALKLPTNTKLIILIQDILMSLENEEMKWCLVQN